ncbi:MAG: hypothetical protein ACRD0O_22150 [Acidimicrobiia bacterium]
MANAWVVSSAGGEEIVVRAADHVPAPPERPEGSDFYMDIPFPHRPDGTTVSHQRSNELFSGRPAGDGAGRSPFRPTSAPPAA